MSLVRREIESGSVSGQIVAHKDVPECTESCRRSVCTQLLSIGHLQMRKKRSLSTSHQLRLDCSPIGSLLLTANHDCLQEIRFEEDPPGTQPAVHCHCSLARQILDSAVEQLLDYFAGHRRQFQLPLRPAPSHFQQIVREQLVQIPWGTTASYGEIAVRMGQPSASRAVGAANGRNPLPIIVPCHRVIGANGQLVGFGGGLERKLTLLRLEGWTDPSRTGSLFPDE